MKLTSSLDGSLKLKEVQIFPGPSLPRRTDNSGGRASRISLKQWRMFHAIVDCDGFTGAANHLHISQSAISYTIAKLQEQLGVQLLKLEGRKAQLTEEGKILLDRSRELVRNAIELEALAENLRQGWGPGIRVVVDPSFPPQLLMLAVRQLAPFPLNLRLSVEEATLDQIKKALHERTADLAISTQVPLGFTGTELIEIEHVVAAHPDHPLFALQREITMEDLERQIQIVISSANDYISTDLNYPLPRYSRLWNVSSFDTAIGALRNGIGYAWLPKYRAQRWLDENQIRILPFNMGSTYKTTLHLVYGRSVTPESGAAKFAGALFNLTTSELIKEKLNVC